MIYTFSGQNTTSIHDFDLASREIINSMVLPVYVEDLEDTGDDIELYFVINTKTKKAVYMSH